MRHYEWMRDYVLSWEKCGFVGHICHGGRSDKGPNGDVVLGGIETASGMGMIIDAILRTMLIAACPYSGGTSCVPVVAGTAALEGTVGWTIAMDGIIRIDNATNDPIEHDQPPIMEQAGAAIAGHSGAKVGKILTDGRDLAMLTEGLAKSVNKLESGELEAIDVLENALDMEGGSDDGG